jgi:DNA replication protein DnaC
LEPRPQALRGLTDPEAERLAELHPGLPSVKNCITCGGSKVFRWRGPDREPAEYDCPCIDQRMMHRYFLHSGLGVLYQRYSWVDAAGVKSSVMDEAFDYVDHMSAFIRTGRGLILRGSMTGTGKTLVAALLFKKMLADGHDGYFTQFNELLDAHSAGWRNEDERKWFIRRVRNAGVLVIDDIGREYAGRGVELVEATLDKVIRARHDECKPTIITTNRDDEWFQTRYQSNVMSLLSGTCEVINVTGEDYRERQRQQAKFEAQNGLVRPIVVG